MLICSDLIVRRSGPTGDSFMVPIRGALMSIVVPMWGALMSNESVMHYTILMLMDLI